MVARVALRVDGLKASVDGKLIVKGVDLSVGRGEVVVLMGPNGAGKSTLAHAVMGKPDYRVEGRVEVDGVDVSGLPTHERARAGLTMAHQSPPELEGVRVREVLTRIAGRFRGLEGPEAVKAAVEALRAVGLPPSFMEREFMVGMSGGERKRLELARILLMNPKAAVLDEPDSGIDVESIPLIASAVNRLAESGAGVLLITHQPHILDHVDYERVLVMYDGRVAAEGGPELVRRVVERGYSWLAKGGGV